MLPPRVPRFWICAPPISAAAAASIGTRAWTRREAADLGVGGQRAEADPAGRRRRMPRSSSRPHRVEERRGRPPCRTAGRRRRRCSRRSARAVRRPAGGGRRAGVRGRASVRRLRRAATGAASWHGSAGGRAAAARPPRRRGRCWRSRCTGTGSRPAPRRWPAVWQPRRIGIAATIMPGVQMPHWARPVALEAALQGPPGAAAAGAFDGGDVRALGVRDRHQARVDRRAVDQDGAGAALALAAAFLGAGEPALLAQHVEQPGHRRHPDAAADAVQREASASSWSAARASCRPPVSAGAPARSPRPRAPAPAWPGSPAGRSRRGGGR